jgi:hypothetical protein
VPSSKGKNTSRIKQNAPKEKAGQNEPPPIDVRISKSYPNISEKY